jgi:hypothetical protein
MTKRTAIRLKARQRQVLFDHRAFGLFEDDQILHFDRETLEVLADVVVAGASVMPEFQAVANEAVVRAIRANALPARPAKNRPSQRVIDQPKKVALVREYLSRVRANEAMRDQGQPGVKSKDEIAGDVVEHAGTTARNLMRWVAEAQKAARRPNSDTPNVAPQNVAADMGLNIEAIPGLGANWMLSVVEHGPVNKPTEEVELRSWPPHHQDE